MVRLTAKTEARPALRGLDIYFGREAPGDWKPFDYAVDGTSLWIWAFGYELIFSLRREGRKPPNSD